MCVKEIHSFFYIQKDVLGISEVNFSGNKMIEKSINKKPWKFRSLFYFEMINTCHRLLFSSMKILIPRYNMISENLYVHTWFIPYSSTHGSMVLHISKGAMAKALMRACGQFPWTLISQVLTPSVVRVSSSTTSAIPIVQQCSNRVKWAKKNENQYLPKAKKCFFEISFIGVANTSNCTFLFILAHYAAQWFTRFPSVRHFFYYTFAAFVVLQNMKMSTFQTD